MRQCCTCYVCVYGELCVYVCQYVYANMCMQLREHVCMRVEWVVEHVQMCSVSGHVRMRVCVCVRVLMCCIYT